jgi:hypothetical protein
MTKNFILTDIMGSDNSHLTMEYLKLASESIDSTDSFYKLHNFNLEKYSRLFAIIDHRTSNRDIWQNVDYWKDLSYRINFLNERGFVFLIGQPWESKENMEDFQSYDQCLKNVRYTTWEGNTDWFWFFMYQKHKNHSFNFDHSKKCKDFLYLNKRARAHRLKLFKELYEKKLLKNSIFSFVDEPYKIRLTSNYELPYVKNYPHYGLDQEMYELPYNHSAISLVSETNIENEKMFFTEKIWKAIIARHIFVIHGKSYYLKKLKEMGFKTFENFFDESYDTETDQDEKIKKIIKLCEKIQNLDYEKLYKETEEIRNHNYNNFFNLDMLKKNINDNLSNFFKFFDRS